MKLLSLSYGQQVQSDFGNIYPFHILKSHKVWLKQNKTSKNLSFREESGEEETLRENTAGWNLAVKSQQSHGGDLLSFLDLREETVSYLHNHEKPEVTQVDGFPRSGCEASHKISSVSLGETLTYA